MSLTLDDIRRIAHLARIGIDAADDAGPTEHSVGDGGEAQAYLAQLSGILGLIDELQAVDTEGIEPMSHAQDVTLRLRDDGVTETDQHEHFQSVAPQVEAGLYLVPKVIE